MNLIRKLFPIILVIILSFFAFKPLLASGFFPIHDDTQVTRVFEMSKALRDGMLPVRWSMDLGFGYGYPIFNFYAPLAYYVGAIPNLVGFDAINSTKLLFLIGIVISGIFMYLFSKEFFGKAGAVLSALLYVYAPYHAVDIYVRGDVSEFFAYAFIPLLFFGLYKTYQTNKLQYSFVASLGFAGIILSHNLTALMISPFALVFASYLIYKNVKSWKYIVLSFVLGLFLSAFYFIPALLEMGYTNVISQIGGGADFKDHFVCIYQLWTSPWGYGGSAKGCVDGLSFMVGKYHIIFAIVFIISLISSVFSKKVSSFFTFQNKNVSIFLLFALFILASIFFMLSYSQFIWEIIKPMEYFQYPWRFLIILSFCLSFLGGGVLLLISKFVRGSWFYLSCVILYVGIVFVNTKFFVPQEITHKSLEYYTSRPSIEWNISKISSEYMPKYLQKPLDEYAIADNFHIYNETRRIQNTKSLNFDIALDYPRIITVPIAYFPAWQAYVDDKIVLISPKSQYEGGMIKFLVEKGKHDVSIKYAETPVERASDFITIAGLLVILIGIIMIKAKYAKS